ncbi:hypothetical protein BVX97_04735 [bacterium E08(2017)]|nr:hypothetical protein BVX97_04735 [bacterium E08(2017)]
MFRLLLPLAPNFNAIFRKKMFDKRREKLGRNIVSAGFEGLISAEEMLSLRVVMPLALGIPWVLFIHSSASANPESILSTAAPALDIVGLLLLSFAPASWLDKAMKSRHKSIQRSLPFVLDILTLSVEAGMDFMTALQKSVERKNIDPLTEELIRVVREIQLGKTRKEALRSMSIRINLQEIRSVVNALIQADELGVSIGSILRIQAEQIRQRRFERAEKLANEAPVKMLGPLLLFIFPAVFVVLLGPMVYRAMQQMF